jgi:L-amino acid N-acyltransferase YncA
VRGATVIELILDHRFRGRGYGKHLSTLLARGVPLPDDQCLMGTIHADNRTSYRSARAAGRVDVGGEIVVPL